MADLPSTVNAPPQTATPLPPEGEPADEFTMLRAWMRYLRASALRKIEGLSPEQLRWRPAPGGNSAGGIVQHLGYAERWWFRIVFAGQDLPLNFKEDGRAFVLAPDATAASVGDFYKRESELADQAIDGASLDEWSRTALGRRSTLRWILTHMVEETARHAGHLDITRELIDGQRGR